MDDLLTEINNQKIAMAATETASNNRPGALLLKIIKKIGIGFFMLSIFIFFYIFGNFGIKALKEALIKTKTRSYKKNPRWLQEVASKSNEITIKELVLPGTHNSSSYKVNTNNLLSKDNKTFNILSKLGIFKYIIKAWTLNQELNITEQLEAGTRWLDVDVAMKNNIYYAVHEFENDKLAKMIDQVKRFSEKYNEPVFLSLTPRDLTIEQIEDLENYIVDKMGECIQSEDCNMLNLINSKLSDIIKRDTKVMIFIDNAKKFYKMSNVQSNWDYVTKTKDKLESIKEKIMDYEIMKKTQPNSNDLYRIAFTVTGDISAVIKTVLYPLNDYTIEDFNKGMNDAFASFYENDLDEDERKSVNIFTFDFITDKNISVIIDRNYMLADMKGNTQSTTPEEE